MKNIDILKSRRSIYEIDDNVKMTDEEIINLVEEITRLVPDAYNIKSQRVVLVLNEEHKKLWDNIYDVFEGKVAREKIDSFKNGYGTVLFFYDYNKVRELEEKFPKIKDNFRPWALQSNGMLQINIWTALSDANLGASLQHYNPVIDEMIKKNYNFPEEYVLLAQLVFGNPLSRPREKEEENIKERVTVIK